MKEIKFTILAAFSLAFWACEQSASDSPVDENESNATLNCYTESLEDSTGIKIICNGDSIGVLMNGTDGKDGKDGSDGKDGEDGSDGKDGENGKNGEDGIDGYTPTVTTSNVEPSKEHPNGGIQIVVTYKDAEGILKGDTSYVWNGTDVVPVSSSSESIPVIESSSSSSELIPESSSSSDEPVLEVSSSSDVPVLEISSSSEEPVVLESSSSSVEPVLEISSSSEEVEEPISSSSEELSEQCLTIRNTIDKFNYLDDVLPCIRSNEKVAYIIRHAERNKSDTGHEGVLNDNGRTQARDIGSRLKNLDYVGNIYFMHTNVYRTMETAMLIAEGKGQEYSETQIPYVYDTGVDHEINMDLTDGYIIKDKEKFDACKSPQGWGWSAYSKAAYEEDDNEACKEVFYDVDDRLNELVSTHFTYEKMHDITIAISHDQLLVPFVASVSQRQIDLRFHLHENDFDYWINYLTGIAIIVNENDEVTMIPVTALNDGFLRTYPDT
ncbi:histidine phosphatase family protein [Fibrobacter sp. UWEL]|uniref:histidine phosphatase family protein n=1 Tax=Fibrobacter sp. UWEL TaxID=1896209 RepID=UPI00091A757B|nr:histidine phosphatase family protein [Fibrobacter sp. UWEL]SHK47803.1 Broad specificity phosphatase PhoE [Fibrobacter sp. UWEL]